GSRPWWSWSSSRHRALARFSHHSGSEARAMSGRHTVRALGPSILPLMSRRSAGPDLRAFIAAARRGVLATIDPDDMPRLVPICYVLATEPQGDSLVLYSALDEKPKRVGDPLALARVRDLLARPAAAVLVDRWSEDWQRLGW